MNLSPIVKFTMREITQDRSIDSVIAAIMFVFEIPYEDAKAVYSEVISQAKVAARATGPFPIAE